MRFPVFIVRRWRKCGTLIVLAFAAAGSLHAAELSGRVTAVENDIVTVKIEGEIRPSVGDKTEIFFKLDEVEVAVANGKIIESGAASSKVKVDKAEGTITEGQLVRITTSASAQTTKSSSNTTEATEANVALRGDWVGTAEDRFKLSFSFKEDNSVVWLVENAQFSAPVVLRGKFRADNTVTPNSIEIFGIEEGDRKGQTLRGIFELQSNGRLKLNFDPDREQEAVMFDRAPSPIVVPANAVTSFQKSVEATPATAPSPR